MWMFFGTEKVSKILFIFVCKKQIQHHYRFKTKPQYYSSKIVVGCPEEFVSEIFSISYWKIRRKKTWKTDAWDRNAREIHGRFKIFDVVSYLCH